MTQESRSAISRTNGAKSRGPVTHAGRKKSSRNALKHGFNSGNIVLLDCESRSEFKRILKEHFAMHKPTNAIQTSLVHQIVATHWRTRRLWTIETALLNLAMFHRFTEDDKTAPSTVETLLANAFRNLVDDHTLALCARYESRLNRMHDRAFQTLRQLQQSAAKTENCETNPAEISVSLYEVNTLPKRGVLKTNPKTPISDSKQRL